MNLVRAFRFDKPQSVAFVGAGGKTTVIFQLARQLSSPVLVTTSTHIGAWQVSLADHHFQIRSNTDLDRIIDEQMSGVVLLTGPEGEFERFSGLNEQQLIRVYKHSREVQIPLLIEADGSRQRPIKAPDLYEPVIPSFVDMVVVVAGLSALDKSLTEHWVHRSHKYAQITGLSTGDRITANSISKMLAHPNGGLQGIPNNVRTVALLNQANTEYLQAKGKKIAYQLLPKYQSVIVASLAGTNELIGNKEVSDDKNNENKVDTNQIYAVIERVAGVVLAAGGSVRMGKPKQLLLWRGKTFVEHVVTIARESGLWPIIVISGANRDQVGQAIRSQSVPEVFNKDWKNGQSSSIRIGLENLPLDIGAVVFLLVDQPHIAPRLVQNLIEVHAQTLAPIVAPQIDGQRGNPVLFDRVTFPDLMSLEGDIGGRAVFSRYSLTWVNWLDPSMLQDVDTLDDYQYLISSDGYDK